MNSPPIASQLSAHFLRIQLSQGLRQLHFAAPLEQHFCAHLRLGHRRSALCTLGIGIIGWWFYTGLDIWRLYALGLGPEFEALLWGSFIPRFFVHLCLGCALWSVLHPRSTQRAYESSFAGTVLALCLCITVSSYTLKNIGMHETSVIMVLMMSVAFFPLGVRLHVMAPTALCASIAFSLAGPVLLHDTTQMREHWVLSAVVWGAFVLSGLMAYYSEKKPT